MTSVDTFNNINNTGQQHLHQFYNSVQSNNCQKSLLAQTTTFVEQECSQIEDLSDIFSENEAIRTETDNEITLTNALQDACFKADTNQFYDQEDQQNRLDEDSEHKDPYQTGKQTVKTTINLAQLLYKAKK